MNIISFSPRNFVNYTLLPVRFVLDKIGSLAKAVFQAFRSYWYPSQIITFSATRAAKLNEGQPSFFELPADVRGLIYLRLSSEAFRNMLFVSKKTYEEYNKWVPDWLARRKASFSKLRLSPRYIRHLLESGNLRRISTAQVSLLSRHSRLDSLTYFETYRSNWAKWVQPNQKNLEVIAKLSCLTFLEMGYNCLDLSNLKQLSNLKALRLHQQVVGSHASSIYSSLLELQGLTLLDMKDARCNLITIAGLSKLIHLKHLYHDGNIVTFHPELETLSMHVNEGSDIGLLCSMTRLKVLNLSHSTGVGEETLSAMASSLKGLNHLDLGVTGPITDEKLRALTLFPALKKLSMLGCPWQGMNGILWSDLTRLTKLDLFGVNLDDEAIRHISHLTNLRHLDLRWNDLTAVVCQPIANLMELRSLSVAFFLDAKGLVCLARLTQLKALVVYSCDVGDNISILSTLTDLKRLDASFNEITGSSLQAMTSLVRLKDLNLSNNPLHGKSLAALTRLTRLKNLHLTGVQLTREEAACFKTSQLKLYL